MNSCPHANIRFCPLYHAAHMIGGENLIRFGCDDGRLDEGGCAVDRGRSYAETVAELAVASPRLAPILRFQEQAEQSAAQRRRNMAGLAGFGRC